MTAYMISWYEEAENTTVKVVRLGTGYTTIELLRMLGKMLEAAIEQQMKKSIKKNSGGPHLKKNTSNLILGTRGCGRVDVVEVRLDSRTVDSQLGLVFEV